MRTAGGPGIRLDDLLAREITLQWAEAVALVQATCRQLVLTAASGFPSTAQIMLYEEGAAVTLATVDQPQVRAAAHLLASVLAGGEPLQLGLLVSQAGGAASPYANLAEFAVALARFGCPDPWTETSPFILGMESPGLAEIRPAGACHQATILSRRMSPAASIAK